MTSNKFQITLAPLIWILQHLIADELFPFDCQGLELQTQPS